MKRYTYDITNMILITEFMSYRFVMYQPLAAQIINEESYSTMYSIGYIYVRWKGLGASVGRVRGNG